MAKLIGSRSIYLSFVCARARARARARVCVCVFSVCAKFVYK